MDKIDRGQVTNFLLGALVVGVVLAFLHFGQTILVTLLLGIFLAYTLNPVVRWLGVLRLPYGITVGLTLVLAIVFLVVAVNLVIASLSGFNEELPRYEERLRERWREAKESLEPVLEKLNPGVPEGEKGEAAPEKAPEPAVRHDLRDLLPVIYSGATSVLSLLFYVIIIPFMTFFMLLEKERFRERITSKREDATAQRTAAILEKISGKIQGYIAGKGIITIILAVLGSLGYWAIGLGFPVVWGVLYALAVLIPFLGVLIAGVPTALFCLVATDGAETLLLVGLVILILQVVENYVLSPLILGDLVDLNPLAVILSVLFWAALWGPVGALLAIPITAIIKVLFDHTEIFEMAGRLLGGERARE
jgi:predicted PurR-regulated permease PerM